MKGRYFRICFRFLGLILAAALVGGWTAVVAKAHTDSTEADVRPIISTAPGSQIPAPSAIASQSDPDANDSDASLNRPAGPVARSVLDFDGDGKTDYGVARNVNGTYAWYLQRSTLGFLGVNWGGLSSSDYLVPGDYDGDGKWDIAVWRPGAQAYFYILRSQTNTLQAVPFGTTGDDPKATQDFDGDGKADPTVTRPEGLTMHWYILRSTLGFIGVDFGNGETDVETRGDFDGDGKADIAVYRTDTGTPANTFFVLRSSNGAVQSQNWGIYPTDYVQPGDFDGDGKTDYAVARISGAAACTWYWLNSSNGSFSQLKFGLAGDFPAVGDYDGDGRADQAVWRSGTPSTFYVNRSTLGFTSFGFGQTNDKVLSFALQAR